MLSICSISAWWGDVKRVEKAITALSGLGRPPPAPSFPAVYIGILKRLHREIPRCMARVVLSYQWERCSFMKDRSLSHLHPYCIGSSCLRPLTLSPVAGHLLPLLPRSLHIKPSPKYSPKAPQ